MKRVRFFKHAWWLALIVLLGVVSQSYAGGWSVVTLSELPEFVVAGDPFAVEFAVRGHGQHLFGGVPAKVTAVSSTTGEIITVTAVDSTVEGYYEATLTLPADGEWLWKISLWNIEYQMPPLTVQAGVETAVFNLPNSQLDMVTALFPILVILGIVGTSLAFVAWWRKRTVLRMGFVLIGCIAMLIGTVWGGRRVETAVAQNDPVSSSPAVAPEDIGEALFVAKGCVSCHQNDKVTMAENMHEIGPNLTNYQGNSDYLTQWLNNPADIKPDTIMPRLYLSDFEISELVTFLSQ